MLICDHLRADNALFQAEGASKLAALRTLTEQLAHSGDIRDAEACLEVLLAREKLMTTGVGKGVALPHAFSPEAPQTVVAYLRSEGGIDFDAIDEKPVHHIFCILGPPSAEGRHLKILARLARLLNHADFLTALQSASTAEELLAALRSQEEALQPHPS
jgi:mannitol/fructose-specific phosphotransferase system IIA component (Ntr-type)